MKFFFIMAFLIVPYHLNAMHKSLNGIEKELVLLYINLHGISDLQRKINPPDLTSQKNIKRPTLNEPPFVFPIKFYFFSIDYECNTLTKAIFDQIKTIESMYGYNPKGITSYDGHYCIKEKPTNYLGHHTRYYWFSHGTVYIRSKIKNKNALKELVEQENTRIRNIVNKSIIS